MKDLRYLLKAQAVAKALQSSANTGMLGHAKEIRTDMVSGFVHLVNAHPPREYTASVSGHSWGTPNHSFSLL